MAEKEREILNYSSLLPARKKSKGERALSFDVLERGREVRRQRTRVGRGRSAGRGKTCGRGQKGQKARSGFSHRPGFEGGQMPLHRRLPKRGFTNIFKKEYQLVNLAMLVRGGLKGEITPEQLEEKGLIGRAGLPVKILGQGELKEALTITADACSQGAREKIEAAGGKCLLREKSSKKKVAQSSADN